MPHMKRKGECDSPEHPSQKKKKTAKAKEVAEKRLGVDGKTVRFAKSPPQKTQERIARALPGAWCRTRLASNVLAHLDRI